MVQKLKKQFYRANKFYEAGLKRIDDYLKPIINIADPDRIASTLINSGKEGVTRLRAIKKSLLVNQKVVKHLIKYFYLIY